LYSQVDVQAGAAPGQQGQCELEHRVLQLLVRLGAANLRQPGLDVTGLAKIDQLHRKGLRHFADALRAVGQEFDPQHGMPFGQLGRRTTEPVVIDSATVEFDVQVARDAAELLITLAADPHGVLHGGQRERCSGVRIVNDLNGFGARLDITPAQQFRPRAHRRLCGK
jgi:hypothetical protein